MQMSWKYLGGDGLKVQGVVEPVVCHFFFSATLAQGLKQNGLPAMFGIIKVNKSICVLCRNVELPGSLATTFFRQIVS